MGARKQPGPIEVPPSFEPVAAAFSKDRQVSLEKGWGAGSVVLKTKEKIFVMFRNGELIAKLPESRVDELVNGGVGHQFDPRGDGRLMKEWIVVPSGKSRWVDLAREAYRFVKGDRIK